MIAINMDYEYLKFLSCFQVMIIAFDVQFESNSKNLIKISLTKFNIQIFFRLKRICRHYLQAALHFQDLFMYGQCLIEHGFYKRMLYQRRYIFMKHIFKIT